MKRKLPSEITVQIDSREKRPMVFPSSIRVEGEGVSRSTKIIKVKTETVMLHAGDYRLKEYPNECVIERKGSQSELITNLFNVKDMQRQARAFNKLAENSNHPILMIECSPQQILTQCTHLKHPDILLDRLYRIAKKFGLEILWMPSAYSITARRQIGKFLIHVMLHNSYKEY